MISRYCVCAEVYNDIWHGQVPSKVLARLVVKVPIQRFSPTMKSRSVMLSAERLKYGLEGKFRSHLRAHSCSVLGSGALQVLIGLGRVEQRRNKHLAFVGI